MNTVIRSYDKPRLDLPSEFEALNELVLDLRWSWSHTADKLWQRIDSELWFQTHNPWLILQNVSLKRLRDLANDPDFLYLLQLLREEQLASKATPAWFQQLQLKFDIGTIAYFSMEFGLSEALPIYSGGLGVLAGDHLKTASELGIPLIGVGLLYQQGYFRQVLDTDGRQLAFYPYNDPSQLPIRPVRDIEGEWLHIEIELPGRILRIRLWQVQVGRILLYLLDSNDPLNSPADRGITSELYGGGSEIRLQQEIVLGIGGYRALKTIGITPEVCHLNEGHAAFVILERTKQFMQHHSIPFDTALSATRVANLFTTHTPIEAGFDYFSTTLIEQYMANYVVDLGISLEQFISLGTTDDDTSFHMAWLAMNGSGAINGVSQLHGKVSRSIFARLFPQWPLTEVPVGHVTNGVHIPSWDSPEADHLWTNACGQERWREELHEIDTAIRNIPDAELWAMRTINRQRLIEWIKKRVNSQYPQHTKLSADKEIILLDPNILTLGFARRFASYKRPNLLLHDPERLVRILRHTDHPVQLVISGKAHPQDRDGQAMIKAWIDFIHEYHLKNQIVFLVDYDLLVAEHLVQGVDVWINTPRRPWEASGTSGMKVLVNGGLNLSTLDGWWAEAWKIDVGWALGDRQKHDNDLMQDKIDAEELYSLLETQIIPAFYERDLQGIPTQWVQRMRNSMASLTPKFSTNRMVREYTERYYIKMASAYRQRINNNAAIAQHIEQWKEKLKKHWNAIHIGVREVKCIETFYHISIPVYLDDLELNDVKVEIYADKNEDHSLEKQTMKPVEALTGSVNGYRFMAKIKTTRSVSDYTVRIIPAHPQAQIPLENCLILWEHK